MPETQPETHHPDRHPDLTAVRAVAFTTCPLLAAHQSALHPGVRTCQMTRLADVGTLPDTDALLLLATTTRTPGRLTGRQRPGHHHRVHRHRPGRRRHLTRATKLRASQIFLQPDQDAQLVDELNWHFDAAT